MEVRRCLVDLRQRRDQARCWNADGKGLVPGERGEKLAECVPRDGDLEVFVVSTLLAEEEVDRPAGGYVPGGLDPCEPPVNLLRPPRIPLKDVGVECRRDG
jgi:hypothetical protein